MNFTVVVPYRNRPEAANRLANAMVNLDVKVVFADSDTDEWNSGRAINLAVEKLDGWILKQDVDCIAYDPALYYMITTPESEKHFKIFGCKYLDRHGKQQGIFCGNEILFHKSAWSAVGGFPEWPGYGFEDYGFTFKLLKNCYKDFGLNPINPLDAQKLMRELTMQINEESLPHFFYHFFHDRSHISIDRANENRVKLYNLICQ